MLFACFITLRAYDVLVLGDTHYDSPGVRREADKLSEARRKELNRNLERWRENVPAVLKAAGARSARDVAFAVQLGDLIQGDCGSEELQAKAFREALDAVNRDLKVTLYPVKGNHDIRGAGAQAAYDRVMLPYLDKAVGAGSAVPGGAHYVKRFDKDLFIFFDSMRPDIDFVEEALKRNPDARYVFFLTHLPVIPCAGGSPDWIVFGRPDRSEERRKLLSLLAGRNAVVLCAHIHRTTLFRYRSPEGTITQLSSFSLPANLSEKFAETYEPDGSKFFKSKAVSNAMRKKEVRNVLSDFKEELVSFGEYRPGAGFNILSADDGGVTVQLYFGACTKPVKVLKLR